MLKKSILIGLIIISLQVGYSNPDVKYINGVKYVDAASYNQLVDSYNDCRTTLGGCVSDLDKNLEFLKEFEKKNLGFPWKKVFIGGGIGFGCGLAFGLGFGLKFRR